MTRHKQYMQGMMHALSAPAVWQAVNLRLIGIPPRAMYARALVPGMRTLGIIASCKLTAHRESMTHHRHGAGYQPVRDQYAGLPTASLRVVSDLVRTARPHGRACQGSQRACRAGKRRCSGGCCSGVLRWPCVQECLRAPPLHAELRTTENGVIPGIRVRERAASAPGRLQ